MGRAPCCDKVGLKKGPWSPEEDQILVSFINQYGHSNWRALPKQAGLLRCGKSCRLRWMNYLKPDIKRGGFTKEEEETIIHLHNIMGNRWSAIAARLPGRTDNEIKNVWHTHLKKKLGKHQTTKQKSKVEASNTTHDNNTSHVTTISSETTSVGTSHQSYSTSDGFSSLSEVSSIYTLNNTHNVKIETEQNFDTRQSDMDNYCPIIDETFWSNQDFHQEDVDDHDVTTPMVSNMGYGDNQWESSKAPSNTFSTMYEEKSLEIHGDNNMDYFWLDVFLRSVDQPELPEF